jgi:hypothetical protein
MTHNTNQSEILIYDKKLSLLKLAVFGLIFILCGIWLFSTKDRFKFIMFPVYPLLIKLLGVCSVFLGLSGIGTSLYKLFVHAPHITINTLGIKQINLFGKPNFVNWESINTFKIEQRRNNMLMIETVNGSHVLTTGTIGMTATELHTIIDRYMSDIITTTPGALSNPEVSPISNIQ